MGSIESWVWDIFLVILSEIIFGLLMWFLLSKFGHKIAINESKKQEIQVLNNFYRKYKELELDELFFDIKHGSDSDNKVLCRTLRIRQIKENGAAQLILNMGKYHLTLSSSERYWNLRYIESGKNDQSVDLLNLLKYIENRCKSNKIDIEK